MCHRMVSSVAIIWIAATSLCLSSLAQEEELPECRDGDVFCYTQTGHKLFGDGQHAEAVEWFKKAGDNPPAIDALGFSYETGQGNPKDLPKAFQLYIEAAEKGYDQAQFHAGNCYARGVGVGVNDKVAMEWFRKAADQGTCTIFPPSSHLRSAIIRVCFSGHPSAAYNAGLRLYDGRGVQMDKMAAVEMFKKAAEAGHTGGMVTSLNCKGLIFDCVLGAAVQCGSLLPQHPRACAERHQSCRVVPEVCPWSNKRSRHGSGFIVVQGCTEGPCRVGHEHRYVLHVWKRPALCP